MGLFGRGKKADIAPSPKSVTPQDVLSDRIKEGFGKFDQDLYDELRLLPLRVAGLSYGDAMARARGSESSPSDAAQYYRTALVIALYEGDGLRVRDAVSGLKKYRSGPRIDRLEQFADIVAEIGYKWLRDPSMQESTTPLKNQR